MHSNKTTVLRVDASRGVDDGRLWVTLVDQLVARGANMTAAQLRADMIVRARRGRIMQGHITLPHLDAAS